MLGNSLPRVIIGIDLNLNYKGWGFYALATSELGVSSWLNNSYYWVSGEDKYSVKALECYDTNNNPAGKYPALTTTSGSNNLMNSDLWIEKSSFVRLKNVEISYTIYNKSASSLTKSVKIYSRGTNLLLLSKIKDLDPEALNAGIDNYPILSNFTVGVAVSF
jgi:TonB-dependent starch-binding outer membrane protein SusC